MEGTAHCMESPEPPSATKELHSPDSVLTWLEDSAPGLVGTVSGCESVLKVRGLTGPRRALEAGFAEGVDTPPASAWTDCVSSWDAQQLRFRVGDRIECNVGGWQSGVIMGLFFAPSNSATSDSLADAGRGSFRTAACYHVQLDSGRQISVRSDSKDAIRGGGALGSVHALQGEVDSLLQRMKTRC